LVSRGQLISEYSSLTEYGLFLGDGVCDENCRQMETGMVLPLDAFVWVFVRFQESYDVDDVDDVDDDVWTLQEGWTVLKTKNSQ